MRRLNLVVALALGACTSGPSETIRPPERRCAEVPACVRGTVWDDNVCRCVSVEGGLPTCTIAAVRCGEGLAFSATVCGCVPIDAGAFDGGAGD